MTFRDLACAHLSEYRRNVLRLDEGVFLYRGRRIRMGHVLPWEHRRKNILQPYRNSFFASEHGAIKLHRYFHHLNSSQALCINLFFPLLAERRKNLLLESLGAHGDTSVVPRFESPSTLEGANRPTSFDFHLGGQGENIFVEVKYTEDGFGAAIDDPEHRLKFQETYLPLLKQSVFLDRSCQDCGVFLRNYQVLRNLAHITDKSRVVFLFPRANRAVAEQADEARKAFLTSKGRNRLHVVFLEDFLSHLTQVARGGNLTGYYESVTTKYLGFRTEPTQVVPADAPSARR